MKDNKIDIMCNKIGNMISILGTANVRCENALIDEVIKGMRVLQEDLEVLRKCTLDNPEFRWKEIWEQK